MLGQDLSGHKATRTGYRVHTRYGWGYTGFTQYSSGLAPHVLGNSVTDLGRNTAVGHTGPGVGVRGVGSVWNHYKYIYSVERGIPRCLGVHYLSKRYGK